MSGINDNNTSSAKSTNPFRRDVHLPTWDEIQATPNGGGPSSHSGVASSETEQGQHPNIQDRVEEAPEYSRYVFPNRMEPLKALESYDVVLLLDDSTSMLWTLSGWPPTYVLPSSRLWNSRMKNTGWHYLSLMLQGIALAITEHDKG
ncbi:Protein of unknown function [Pyronema omphalodes CBS 100304]|uniref:Uncharacterized protein n=1 Tax=Pyronema omphalodes (strain CBS 100304) TaxID=1076935 RepID=U4L7H3_PYROM|nr:Protein of unknown function [Pyronema omphalodes CBS 100304]